MTEGDTGDVSAKSGRGMRPDVAIGGGERICRLPPDRAPDGAADRMIGRSERDASRPAAAGARVHRSTEPAPARGNADANHAHAPNQHEEQPVGEEWTRHGKSRGY